MNQAFSTQFKFVVALLILAMFVLFVAVSTMINGIRIDNAVRVEPVVQAVPAPMLPEFEEQELEPAITVEPDLDDAELDCLAKNIYHEARGESKAGKIAVAHVTMNRVNSNRFPDTVCDVVHQAIYSAWWLQAKGRKVPIRHKCQFSWYCDGKSDRVRLTTADGNPILPNVRAWSESQEVALQVMMGVIADNTDGATFYYNPSLADPHWKHAFEKTVIVDNHKFMRMP